MTSGNINFRNVKEAVSKGQPFLSFINQHIIVNNFSQLVDI